MRGVGLLERQRKDKAKPVKVLFCASDSGAEPLKDELLEMGIDPDTDELFQGDLWEADLTRADLDGSNLFDTNLWDAVMKETLYNNANLKRTNIQKARI